MRRSAVPEGSAQSAASIVPIPLSVSSGIRRAVKYAPSIVVAVVMTPSRAAGSPNPNV